MTTLGSLGDLHPCLALSLELMRRGHRVTLASTEYYRTKVEALKIGFHPIGPAWDPTDREIIRQCEDLKSGFEILFRKIIFPRLRATYDDLLPAAANSDLMIAGEANYAAPLVAEKLGLRWVSAILSPVSFVSVHDPSVLANVPWLIHLRKAGWPVYWAALNLGRMGIKHWWEPVRRLRREENLRPQCDPVFRDKFSPDLVLALFSQWLARPQPDWPAQTQQPGFVFFDRQGAREDTNPELEAFLAAGEPPIVFTQGSTAVNNPGNFYAVSAEAAKRLGRRALLIGGTAAPEPTSSQLLALPYAPYSQVFPHAAIIVHQGGSGTTGQALRAAKPQLIVPYGWDQPDNAARVERLGSGLHLPRKNYAASSATKLLDQLLRDARFAERATQVGKHIQAEDALTPACDAIESLLQV